MQLLLELFLLLLLLLLSVAAGLTCCIAAAAAAWTVPLLLLYLLLQCMCVTPASSTGDGTVWLLCAGPLAGPSQLALQTFSCALVCCWCSIRTLSC
jgi:hypothetical protein